jgi:predicted transporter
METIYVLSAGLGAVMTLVLVGKCIRSRSAKPKVGANLTWDRYVFATAYSLLFTVMNVLSAATSESWTAVTMLFGAPFIIAALMIKKYQRLG